MASNLMLLWGAVFVGSVAFLVFQRGKRNILFDQLQIRRRRVSGAKTPPRYLSPGNDQVASSDPDYSHTFPPSRTFTLDNLSAFSRLDQESQKLDEPPRDWTTNLLPLETSYLNANDSMHTPCEFSVKDIKALGDFPDYSTLSGVPLPDPYLDFDIKKALPRPYRPFRWAYHQTMCRSS